MPELYRDNALTVGQLKEALKNVPDDALVGQSIFDITGHVTKVDRLLYCKEHNIVTLDSDKHVGTFSDEEFEDGPFDVIARATEQS